MSPIEPGVYPGISEADYHAIKLPSKSLLWREMRGDSMKAIASKSALRGSLFHCVTLRLEDLHNEYYFTSEEFRRIGPKWKRIQEEAGGRIPVKRGELEETVRMSQACHASCGDVLGKATNREVSIIADLDGMRCKSRVDIYGDGILADLKSTQASDDKYFAADAQKYGYLVQLCFYRKMLQAHGIKIDSVYLLPVYSRGKECKAWVHRPGKEELLEAENLCDYMIDLYRRRTAKTELGHGAASQTEGEVDDGNDVELDW
jgi:hypothetical protein